MEKKSKCTKCEFNREKESQHGMIYYFNVEFENGDKGSYGAKDKDDPKFKVGEESEYDITEKDFGGAIFYNIKPIYKNNGGFSNGQTNQKGIFACSALNRAVDYVVGTKGKDATIEQVREYTHKFYELLTDITHK